MCNVHIIQQESLLSLFVCIHFLGSWSESNPQCAFVCLSQSLTENQNCAICVKSLIYYRLRKQIQIFQGCFVMAYYSKCPSVRAIWKYLLDNIYVGNMWLFSRDLKAKDKDQYIDVHPNQWLNRLETQLYKQPIKIQVPKVVDNK